MDTDSLTASCWQYKSDTASLKIIRDNLRLFLLSRNSTDIDVDKIIIAVNEACMNIVQHANKGQYCGFINVSCKVDENVLSIIISDDAKFSDSPQLMPVNNDLLKPGGRGLHIIEEIMDSMIFSHKDGTRGNILTLMKYL
ncbi:MAG: ATP-binding protein [Gammaproteobacteria bacterium]|nr:ATP-binding protein [Gammaproteobacteria bacterium]